MRKYKGILPAFVHPPHGVPQLFMRSMHDSYKAGVFQHDWTCGTSSRTNAVRTENGWNFLKSDAEWIFLVDTDMVWGPQDIITLKKFADRKSIKAVSGWALAPKNGLWPHAYRADEEDAGYVPWGEIKPFSDPLVVDAVGGACFLVHRDVYTEIAEALKGTTAYLWQEETYNEHYNLQSGEDIAFSDRIRRLTDHEIWYHPNAIFTHIKAQPLGPKEYLTYIDRLQEKINKG